MMGAKVDQAVKISVAIIARDEESIIADCLDSVSEADEIVVVDTGSVDGTKEVVKAYTDKIHDFEWKSDFASAYNFAKSNCIYPWVLSIDADQTLTTPFSSVRSAAREAQGAYLDVKIANPRLYYFAPRLIKNNIFVKWVGSVHRYLNVWDHWDRSAIEIEEGNSPTHEQNPDRRLNMLHDALAKTPIPRYFFYMGMEYAMRGDWNKAMEAFDRFLGMPYWGFYKAEANLMLAKIWRDKKNLISSREYAMRAWQINPDFREAADFLAFISHAEEREQWKNRRDQADGSDVLFYRNGNWLS